MADCSDGSHGSRRWHRCKALVERFPTVPCSSANSIQVGSSDSECASAQSLSARRGVIMRDH
eukprot:7204087-Prymnesium_polylepis.1